MNTQEIISKYPILNRCWTPNFDHGIFITKTSLIKMVGPFDPWNQHLVLLGCKIERDGLGEVLNWDSTSQIGGNTVDLTIINDTTGP